MRYFTLIAFCLLASIGFAQKIGFKGTVIDSTTQEPLPYATIAALSPEDSTMIGFGITNDDGFFEVRMDDYGDYILKIVLVGYTNIEENMSLTAENPIKDFGTIYMSDQVLNTLDITAEHIPVLINGDTVEYNADAFKTDANAAVEDLIRKLPGMEVDQDGNVKAQGEEVTKIYVDGKEFFGDDPKVATKNLPADAVKKVQVYDKKSETAEFTGVDDGTREKTINIELKDDKKGGVFGKLTGGYGYPDDRFKLKGNLNKFNDKMQLSLIGMGNNTSEDGFTWEDYVGFMGGWKNMSSGGRFRFNSDNVGIPIGGGVGDGLITTASGGLNLNYQFNKNTKINTSYFVYRGHTDLIQSEFRNNILDSINYFTQDSTIQSSTQWSHRANIRFDHTIDSLRELTIRASGSYSTDDFLNNTNNITYTGEGVTLNSGDRTNYYDGDAYTAEMSMVFRNKFKKEGRNLVLEGGGGYSSSNYGGGLDNISSFNSGGTNYIDTIAQKMFDLTDAYNWSGELSFTEPLGNNMFLLLSAEHGEDVDDSKYDVFDYIAEPVAQQTFNYNLSSNYERGYSYTETSAAFRWIKDKWNFNPGLNFKWIGIDGDDFLLDTLITRDYFNALPYFSVRWNPSQGKRLRINYDTEINAPTITQLQTRVDNSNPFNIVIGNPELKPEYEHALNFGGGAFNQFSMSGWYAGAQGAFTQDKIQYATTITPEFVNISQPINVDKDLSGYFYSGFYAPFRIKKLKMKLNANVNGGASQGYFYINDDESASQGLNGSFSLNIENAKKEKIDVSFGGTVSGSQTTYDNSSYSDQTFSSISGYVDLKIYVKENWILRSSYDHTQYNSQAFKEATVVPLLRASISRYLMKKQGEFKFEVFDIFNQNRGVSRTANLNFLQETRTNSIGRYFMVSFTYSLQKLGQKEKGFMMTHRR